MLTLLFFCCNLLRYSPKSNVLFFVTEVYDLNHWAGQIGCRIANVEAKLRRDMLPNAQAKSFESQF